MDNPQYYQPLSHALHAPLVSASHSSPRPQYASYTPHQQPAVTNGAGSGHREEEEEEEEDDEEVVEEELEHHDADPPHQSASSHSSPRANAAQTQSRTNAPASSAPVIDYYAPPAPQQDSKQGLNEDGTEKRKPGRPRGSKNRKPRVSAGSAPKAPTNVAHPGFYQYPPAPPANVSQNQQFYEFQWRALNLCSEFYNAAEELVKAASPMVIAQCYQAGPATKIDPLMMIADAKRVCDNLLANPSQLVGQPVPTTYPSYASMPPPPQPGTSGSTGTAPAPGAVITNPQTFVMPLNSSSMPPPAQPYYAPMYSAPPGARYPTAPYYYPPPQGAAPYYPPPAQPAQSVSAPPAQSSPPPAAPTPAPPAPQPAPAPPPAPVPSNTGTISTFSAATGNTAPGGHQGTWSEDETDRLKRLAEQSKEMGGPQNKGEIEWDWVIQQWGNSRTRHQILLKATSLGLKESTTRGTKRRREAEPTPDTAAPPPPPPPQQQQPPPQQPPPQQQQHQPSHQPQQHQSSQHHTQHSQHQHQHHPQPPQQQTTASSVVSPARSPITSTPTSINASPAMQPQRPPSSAIPGTGVITPARTTSNTANTSTPASNLPWPMPTVAVNTPSPVMSSASVDRNNTYYRPRPTQTTSYSAAATAASTTTRPPSSHGSTTTHHQYMYQTNGAGARRDSRA